MRYYHWFFLVSFCLAAAGSFAMEPPEYIEERIDAHTISTPIEEYDYNFYVVMRKVFKWVELGKTYGLATTDIEKIRAGAPSTTASHAAMKPARDRIASILRSDTPSAVEVGYQLNAARDAELSAKEAHYRSVFRSLSAEGQAILEAEYQRRLRNRQTPIKTLDYAGLAADVPEYVLTFASERGGAVVPNTTVSVPPELAGKVYFDSNSGN